MNESINNFNLTLEEVKYEKLSMGETTNQQ